MEPLKIPEPRRPERLNRLALVAVVTVLGVALLAVLLTLRPQAGPKPGAVEPEPPAAAAPGFLDRAPKPPPEKAAPAPAASADYWEEALRQAQAAAPSAGGLGAGPGGAAGPPGGVGVPGPGGFGPEAGLGHAPAAVSRREEAYRQALVAPLSPARSAAAGGGEPERPFVPLPAPGALPGGALGTLPAPPAAGAGAGPAAATSAPTSAAGRTDHQGFLRRSESLAPTALEARFDPAPEGAWVLDAGTVIPAVLVTAANSELAGPLMAQVSRDVYDRTERQVLIPKGSRLLGSYDNQVVLGERRLLVAWSRLIFPEGGGLSFPGLPAATRSGEAGLSGSVDNHLARVFGSALLLSIVSAGAQLSQPQQSAAFGSAASALQVAAAALGQELSSVGLELLRREMSVPPTLRIPAGTSFLVVLRGDVSFPRSTTIR
jgi:type IV secretion system protein VirB10